MSQPFLANDLFYVSWNEDATWFGETKGTLTNSLYYSVPFGNERINFSHRKNDYHNMKQAVLESMLTHLQEQRKRMLV